MADMRMFSRRSDIMLCDIRRSRYHRYLIYQTNPVRRRKCLGHKLSLPLWETKAFGKCRYDNTLQRVSAKVRCNGTMEDGSAFEAEFVTDGDDPRMLSDFELADLPPTLLEATPKRPALKQGRKREEWM